MGKFTLNFEGDTENPFDVKTVEIFMSASYQMGPNRPRQDGPAKGAPLSVVPSTTATPPTEEPPTEEPPTEEPPTEEPPPKKRRRRTKAEMEAARAAKTPANKKPEPDADPMEMPFDDLLDRAETKGSGDAENYPGCTRDLKAILNRTLKECTGDDKVRASIVSFVQSCEKPDGSPCVKIPDLNFSHAAAAVLWSRDTVKKWRAANNG